MYPLAGDNLEAVFLEIFGTVLLRGLVEFDTVVHRHTRDQHLLTPADRVQRIALNRRFSINGGHYYTSKS